ncbi:J domain-containing protein [Chamaesiphon minutus]|uniref:DnaJ-class molecular chaperone with C-terminal Zn finger domain n=1 Tax=Chamaesiphon minutus (strain ATCC 27169 / PCC 6605) TaxID=1173020 RepID=K9UNH9_CHAP6|nr:J domain-containing protein [Chamaesiphon minutus]AFY96228.1 DnaJ-class molecular chaperone with C-terminal Zn finger domain [Chamaesiphon minutus PCC 6605]
MKSNITLDKSYELFGLTRSASIDEIKSIYRQMAKEIHPDLNPNDVTALDRFNTLNQAYQLLLDAAQSVNNIDPEATDKATANENMDARVDGVRITYIVDPPLSPEDLQLKQEIFASLEKILRRGDFRQAVTTIDLLVRVIPNRNEIVKKQSEVYFKYAQELVNGRRQLNLARTYLKESVKLNPHDPQHWEAVNRQFNRIERLLK